MDRPPQSPDRKIYKGDLPITWKITLQTPAVAPATTPEALDVSASELSASVWDNGVEVAPLEIDRRQDASGVLFLTLTQQVYDQVGKFFRWRLREDTIYRGMMVEGKFEKADV